LHSATGFQDRREVRDALAILKFLVNPHDNYNLIQVLRAPWFHIPDEHILSVTQSNPDSFWREFLTKTEDSNFEAVARLKKYLTDSFEEGISQTLEKILVETAMLDLSFYLDNSGRRESNLWKLLVQLKTEDHQPHFNFLDFINRRKASLSLEEDVEDSDAVSSIEPNSVQLMTVHKSKGLEFDHVIVPFVDKMPQRTRFLKFLFDEESEKIGLTLKLDQEDNLKPLPAQNFLEKIKEEEIREGDRLLYVAMTRAKQTIFLSTCGAKQQKDSWYKNMGITLAVGEHKHEAFSYVVEEGPWNYDPFVFQTHLNQKIVDPLFDLQKMEQEKSSSVTAEIQKQPLKHENILANLERAQYGRWAHQVFESLKYGKNLTSDARVQKAIQYVLKIKDVPFQKILDAGFAEWGFVYQIDNKSTSGQIDLWGVADQKLWIIDYKTGTTKHKEQAFLQLEQYSQALKDYLGAKTPKEILLVALYPFEEKYFIKNI